ncbi:MAG: hypothetical protein QGG42_11740 [Phycisphaerae bacterium]|jgi:hypothetical protein|nr:hypothetical protein [Phycisphaerae bacterium]
MKFSIPCLLVVVLLTIAQPVSADLLNGGLESGDFTSWTTDQDIYSSSWFGGIQVVESHGIITDAYEGDYFAKLPAYSSFYQDITWSKDDTLTFKWAFEGLQQTSMGQKKVGAISVDDSDPGWLHLDMLQEATYWSGGNVTTWQAYTYTFLSNGSGTVRFWMSWVESPGGTVPAYLYIDDIQYTPTPSAILILAPCAVALLKRRRRAAG